MKIGLDFDGVISDCGRLKSDGAKKIYGVEIPPERFKKELVVDAGILTLNQYKYLQKQIYGTREIGLTMLPVEGVLEFVPLLQMEGHDLRIITSRTGSKSEIAREWLRLKGLDLHIRGVGKNVSKAKACRGLDIYIDDDLDKLESLIDIVPHRYLFSWGYNKHIEIPNEVAKRINSWRDFYEEIKMLSLSQAL